MNVKFVQKYIYILICTVVLGTVLFFALFNKYNPPLKFCVSNQFGSKEISIFETNDNKCYVFLPSYATLKNVTIVLPANKQITLGDYTMSNGMNCSDFRFETPYSFVDGNNVKELYFYQSNNVSTLYVDTLSGDMEHIHSNKDIEETASIVLYTSDGMIDYIDAYSTLKGRGNTTWNYNKKPYLLKLSNSTNLLGMGTSKNWVLLANAADGSNINNKIIYDLAKEVGFDWTPDCEYVDVYLNGEYNGLYLLTEKIEVGYNKLDLNENAEDFFCEFRLGESEDERSYYTQTPKGRTVLLAYPKNIDTNRKTRISNLVNQMEHELLSGSDLTKSSIIDLDSWVKKYILDEISANVDSDRASCYFYYKNGRFYAGPIWDYDKGFGNCQQSKNPFSFVASNKNRSSSYQLPYYYDLYNNPSFRNRVCELYQSEFLPKLIELTNYGISNLSNHISSSSKLDKIRWSGLTPLTQSTALISTDAETVLEYLKEKIRFLNSTWLEGTDYCTVQFELATGAEYVNYAVKRGELFQAVDIDFKNTTWINLNTGQIFDIKQPITQDLILVKKDVESNSLAKTQNIYNNLSTREVLAVFGVIALFLLLISMITIDFRRNRKERR